MWPITCLFSLLWTVSCDALEEFHPNSPLSVFEKWRWSEIEIPVGYDIFCGCELSNLDLCFASTEGLLVYNGYDLEKIPYPENYSLLYPYSIYNKEGVGVYVITSAGLFLYDGKWNHLFESGVVRINSDHLFFNDRHGALYLSADRYIWLLEGAKATALASLDENVLSSVVTADNHLFISVENKKYIYRIPLSRKGISNPETWDLLPLPESCAGARRLFVYGENDLFAVNYQQSNPALWYDLYENRWETINVGEYPISHSHMSGATINENTSVVFTKTALHFYHKLKWYTLRSEEWDIPTNEAFMFHRKNGNVILGGRGDKVWELNLNYKRWHTFSGLNFQCDDMWGNSWFISDNGSIIEYRTLTQKWYIHEAGVLSVPKSIILSDDGFLWASGSHEGVAAVSFYDGIEWKLNLHPPLKTMIGHLSARVLSNGNIFFASGHEFEMEGGGVVVYSKEDKEYDFEYISYPYVPSRIVGIAEPEPGILFFGGGKLAFTRYPFKEACSFVEIPGVNWIDHLIEGKNNSVNIALWERNLISDNTLNQISDKVEIPLHFYAAHHLLNDSLCDQNLWVINNTSISCFDGESWITPAIHESIRFVREGGSLKQASDGSVWINFTPREWNFSLKKENLPKFPDHFFKTIKFKPDNEAPIVRIVHADTKVMESSNVLVKWEGKDRWALTPKDQLEYSMKIDHEPWSEFEKRTERILLGLNAGLHRVEIRVRDLDGNYNQKPESIEIEIIPPLWKRPWMQVSTFFIFATIIFLLALLIRQRVQHLLDLKDFKLQFFTNISHELRTPLTVIMWPLKKALDVMVESPERSQIEIAYSNARKMSLLIDQILEFRRIESGKLESHLVVGDLSKSIQDSVALLLPMAEEKKLNFNSGYSHQSYFAVFDFEKLERVITNLFSNAVKYSYERGSISLQVKIDDDYEHSKQKLVMTFEDDGLGIDTDKLDQIFEPFFRVKHRNYKIRGMGLGLALVKNLVQSMEGIILVESPSKIVEGKPRGSRFIVEVPFDKADPDSSVIVDECDISSYSDSEDTGLNNEKKILMIVEDSDDIRTFIVSEFEPEYDTIQCENGKVAYQQAVRSIPDLIITDIMMPGIDGNELIQKIRSNAATRHIPIVALSALKSEDHELRSLNLGADDYLSKPASFPVLKQKIKNLIYARQLVIDQYQKTLLGESKSIVQNSIDDEFLSRCKDLVDERMNDPLFDINAMAEEFGMSRMSLYRKFNAITGDSPGDFVRELKMQKAAELLLNKELTVSEISDVVGFNEVTNFSKAFKKRFGKPPTQYRGI